MTHFKYGRETHTNMQGNVMRFSEVDKKGGHTKRRIVAYIIGHFEEKQWVHDERRHFLGWVCRLTRVGDSISKLEQFHG